jgi:hypothetical protein
MTHRRCPNGMGLDTKREYLHRIASGRLRYLVFEAASDIAVRGCAETALLRYTARISIAEDGGGVTSITCWHTDCYERGDKGWQAVWSQATIIRPD